MLETRSNGEWASLYLVIGNLKAFSRIKGQFLIQLNTIQNACKVQYETYLELCKAKFEENPELERTEQNNRIIHNQVLTELSESNSELTIQKLAPEFLNDLDIPPGTSDLILSIVEAI